jgi:hypothetical protein
MVRKVNTKLLSDVRNSGSSLLSMVRAGGINRLNPYLAIDLID